MGRLAGRRAIVTGAARGIGQAVVTLFTRERAGVVALDHRAMDAPPGGLTLKVDLRDLDAANGAMGTAINRLGGLDILVNTAAALTQGARAENLALSA